MVQWANVTGVIGSITLVVGAILGWGIFPTVVNKKVEKSVILMKGTEQYERFVDIPQPISFKVYIFNVTNPEKVQNGALPIVNELGPYVYKQYRRKSINEASGDETRITFTQEQKFIFDSEASAPYSESDRVIGLNVHMNAFLQSFEREINEILNNILSKLNNQLDRTPIIRIIKRIIDRIRRRYKVVENSALTNFLLKDMDSNLDMIFNNPTSMFITTTVKEYLFDGIKFCKNTKGFAKIICTQIKERKSKTIRSMADGSLAFSFFNHKNRTDDGVFEIHTGKGNPQKLQQILKWNGLRTLQTWLNPSDDEISICNLINGTDASAYPPFRHHNDSLYIFSPDICRSVQLFYEKEIKYKGIPGYRYTTRNFLNKIGPEYSTECFCTNKMNYLIKKQNGCLYTGALDLSNCVGAPIILTLPHMLGAAKQYRNLVKGLKPNPREHDMFIDIQYLTGVPLQGGKRVQFNMFLKKIDQISLTQNLTTSLIPVIWVEEGIALNNEMVDKLKKELINPLNILDIVHWTIFLSGLILIFISLLMHLSQTKIFLKPQMK